MIRLLIEELNKLSNRKFAYGHDFIKGYFIVDVTGINNAKEYIDKSDSLQRVWLNDSPTDETDVEFFKTQFSL